MVCADHQGNAPRLTNVSSHARAPAPQTQRALPCRYWERATWSRTRGPQVSPISLNLILIDQALAAGGQRVIVPLGTDTKIDIPNSSPPPLA